MYFPSSFYAFPPSQNMARSLFSYVVFLLFSISSPVSFLLSFSLSCPAFPLLSFLSRAYHTLFFTLSFPPSHHSFTLSLLIHAYLSVLFTSSCPLAHFVYFSFFPRSHSLPLLFFLFFLTPFVYLPLSLPFLSLSAVTLYIPVPFNLACLTVITYLSQHIPFSLHPFSPYPFPFFPRPFSPSPLKAPSSRNSHRSRLYRQILPITNLLLRFPIARTRADTPTPQDCLDITPASTGYANVQGESYE